MNVTEVCYIQQLNTCVGKFPSDKNGCSSLIYFWSNLFSCSPASVCGRALFDIPTATPLTCNAAVSSPDDSSDHVYICDDASADIQFDHVSPSRLRRVLSADVEWSPGWSFSSTVSPIDILCAIMLWWLGWWSVHVMACTWKEMATPCLEKANELGRHFHKFLKVKRVWDCARLTNN